MKTFTITYVLFRRSYTKTVEAENQRTALKVFKEVMQPATYKLLKIENVEMI